MMTSLILFINCILIVHSYKIPLPRFKRNSEFGATKKEKPHIVIVTASELGWDDISKHGSPLALTPNLHTLSKHGIHFSHHYITPWDFTTRVELFTGEYASHQGLQHGNVTNDQPIGLDPNTKILPEYLKELGYNTTLLGKWGLGFYNKDLTPTNKGYDYFKGSLGFDGIDYYNYTSSSKYQGYDLYENDQPTYPNNTQHLTELLTEQATEIIHNQVNSTKPLFLHVSFQSPQFASITKKPQVPSHWMKPFEGIFNDTDRVGHSAMVLSLDVAVGKIMDALSVANIFDDTFFLFLTTSTSKSCSSVHGVGCNYPLKGGKGTYWEGGVRSMAMVYSGDITTPGITIKDTIHITDWMPTILNLASQKKSSKLNTFHGFDLSNVISKGEKSKREFILHGYDPLANNSGAIRLRDYKLVINQPLDERSDWTKYFAFDRNKSRNLEIPGFRPLSDSKQDVDSVVLCDSGFPHPYLRLRAPPCIPSEKPCLFNILWDPCEYHNLADFLPKTAHYLYENTKMVLDSGYIKKPLYPESDINSDPKNFNNTWAPWIKSSFLGDQSKLENLSNLLEEDKIIILNNNSTKQSNNSIDTSPSNNATVGKTRASPNDSLEKENFPYKLINEDEIESFGQDNSPEALEKYGGHKILKISCEELDYYNYTIECISITTNPADKMNSTNGGNDMDFVKLGTYAENITDRILEDDLFKLGSGNANVSIHSNTSDTSNSDPFQQSFNKLFDNNNQTTGTAELNDDKLVKNINVIPLQNISQTDQKNISRPIPVNVERFSLEEKPERSMDTNETIDITNTYTITSTTPFPTTPNVTHTVGQEIDNKNESLANDEMKKKLESSFKIAKAEGTTKLVGPFNEKNSTLKLLTNAIAGNLTDEKKENYPNELNTDQSNNPNIDWHLTSKAVSVDVNPNITQNNNWTNMRDTNWTSGTNHNWENFSKIDKFSNTRTNFSEFKPEARNIQPQELPAPPLELNSDVKAIADANRNENINVSTLSLNKSQKPNSTIQNTVEKPNYGTIQNPIHNVTNNTSQKSLIKDGDSFRSLEIINESLDQNATLAKNKCNCDNNIEGGVPCEKCLDEKSKDKSSLLTLTNSFENTKNTHSQNLEHLNQISNEKNDGIPFSGQIEMSDKKFNVEGTVKEDSQGRTITNGDYSVSATNDNLIGMRLLKNGGYDPKQQSHNQELEFMESSANLKLTPATNTNDHLKSNKKHKTRILRTKKGLIELVGELGDSNDEVSTSNISDNSTSSSTNDSSVSKIISNLEKLLVTKIPTENNTLDNIKDLFKSHMMDMVFGHNLTENATTLLPNNISSVNENHLTGYENKTNNFPSGVNESSSQKKALVNSQESFETDDAKKDSIATTSSGSKTNQVATLIAIILAGLIVIGMGIVAVVAVVSKSIADRTTSSNSKSSNKNHSPSSSKSLRLKEKIPFNA